MLSERRLSVLMSTLLIAFNNIKLVTSMYSIYLSGCLYYVLIIENKLRCST